jgi:hypothetical protein
LPEKVVTQLFYDAFPVRQSQVASHVNGSHAALTQMTENFPAILQYIPAVLGSLTAQVAGTFVRIRRRFWRLGHLLSKRIKKAKTDSV